MRVVITGGAGFLGSHLCDRLVGLGHAVVCVDNFITGRPENIAHLMGHERFSFVKYNVCDYLHRHRATQLYVVSLLEFLDRNLGSDKPFPYLNRTGSAQSTRHPNVTRYGEIHLGEFRLALEFLHDDCDGPCM